jgi:Tol biopolymer transport system component
VPFDARRQQVSGDAVAVDLGRLQTTGDYGPRRPSAVAGVSRNGVLVYRQGERPSGDATTMVWIDAAGRETPLAAPTGKRYLSPRVSPDGRRVAVRVEEEEDIYLWDEAGGALTRLTFDPTADAGPVWTRDGSRITFHSRRDGDGGIYWKAADGSGEVERLLIDTSTALAPSPYSWSPDGDLLFNTSGNDAIGLLRMADERHVRILLDAAAVERRPALSPDGRWLAFQSFDGSRWNVFVHPFPDVTDGRWQVSADSGEEPVWAPDGGSLFYVNRAARRLMSVSIDTTAGFSTGSPQALFDVSPYSLELANHSNYDVAPDGRFLFIKPQSGIAADGGEQLVVVLDVLEALKRLVPVR